jgi:hypothetical protein
MIAEFTVNAAEDKVRYTKLISVSSEGWTTL